MMNTTTNNTMALVNETLTKDEVMSLFNQMLTRNGNINDYVDILKGEFTEWSGEVHKGFIVQHIHKEPHVVPKMHDYYFMEVTLEEVENPFRNCHLWEPTFHKLMPISGPNTKRKLPTPTEGDMNDLCNIIINNAMIDKWCYTLVPMTEKELAEERKRNPFLHRNFTTKVVPLTYNDIWCHWSTPLTAEEQAQAEKKKKESESALISRFSTGELPPAEDDVWYSVLSGGYGTKGYDLECKIVKTLRDRGYSVRIDGEKDSFGWVTRGIFVNGEVMCLI